MTPEEIQLPAGEAEAEPAEHGMPSWISRKSEKPGEAAILAAGIASNVDQGIDQTGDLPDWLTGIGQGSDLPEAVLGQTDELPPESREELPAELPAASMAQEGTEEEETPPAETPETTPPGQEKKAGWLLGAAAAAAALGAAGKKEAASTEPQVAGEEASAQAGSSLDEAEPAWIAGLAAAAPETPTDEPAAPETKVAPFSEGSEEEIESGALEPQELPEWLIGVQVADAMNQDAKLPPLPERYPG